ncbi:MAG: hypothetical protein AAB544_02920 [Patescibacteria group bacterium]
MPRSRYEARAPPRAQDIAPDPWRFSFDLYAAKRDGCAGSLNIDRDDFGASDHLVRDLGEEVVDRQLPLLNGRCPHHQDYGQPEGQYRYETPVHQIKRHYWNLGLLGHPQFGSVRAQVGDQVADARC